MNDRTKLRDVWVFHVSTEDVVAAAKARTAFHAGRRQHWSDERDRIEALLRTEGIQFHQTVRAGHMSSTGYGQAATFDNQLMRQHQEAQERIDFHETAREKMAGYAHALSRVSGQSLELTVDDFLYFWPHLSTEE